MIASDARFLRWPLIAGALLALLSVMAGAFGAHALKTVVSADYLEVFQTGARYQMYHALALILVALASSLPLSRRLLNWAARCFCVGTLLFSGSLYSLVLTDIHWLGAITPLGGLGFMAGWVCLVAAGWRAPVPSQESNDNADNTQR